MKVENNPIPRCAPPLTRAKEQPKATKEMILVSEEDYSKYSDNEQQRTLFGRLQI